MRKLFHIFEFIEREGVSVFFRTLRTLLKRKIFVLSEHIRYRGSSMNTYSQYAEDLFIHRFFSYKQDGSYIDVGANHPDVLSNTKNYIILGGTE